MFQISEKTRRRLLTVSLMLLSAIIPSTIAIVAIDYHNTHPKIVYYDFNDTIKVTNSDWKYNMLPQEWSSYIVNLCDEVGVDSDLVVSIILKENPECDANAMHLNPNGTIDVGVGQLNDKYLYMTFIPRYWYFDFDCNPFNWKMNIYIVVHHIAYLEDTLKIQDHVIMAYNCGEYAVMNNTIPESTRSYLATVNNTYKLFKERNVEY